MHNLDGCDVPDCVMCEWAVWRVIAGVKELIHAMMAAEDLPVITYTRWMPGDE